MKELKETKTLLQQILVQAPAKENCTELENNMYTNMENLLKNICECLGLAK